jgi:hypothetical protein
MTSWEQHANLASEDITLPAQGPPNANRATLVLLVTSMAVGRATIAHRQHLMMTKVRQHALNVTLAKSQPSTVRPAARTAPQERLN